ncbi:MAG: hypothetical protein MdMp024_0625 [Bacteroidales bacterium]
MRLFPIRRTLYAIPLLLLLCAAALPAFADGTINIANPGDGNGWRSNGGTVVTIFANGNYTVTGASTVFRIVVSEDVTATITLQDAKIHSALGCPFMLSSNDTGGSDVTLILSGTNELVTTKGSPSPAGLQVEDNARILIKGDGSLLVKGGYDATAGIGGGAGIGSGSRRNAGNITIAGGTINATGGIVAAGIGGGVGGDGGNITITGGTITATGGANGAGIGGGQSGDCGNITITGGAITATGGSLGSGIGGGGGGDGGNITITGGMITATAGEFSAAIGGNSAGNGGTITISGGTIVAYAWAGGTGDPAAIGGGAWGPAGIINISGGTVYASRGTGPGIGGGNGTGGGMITITGGVVIADAIGIGKVSRTATVISGAKTLVLSPSINTGTFGEATVRQHVVVNINSGPNNDVILNENVTIPDGMMFVVPDGIILNVNNYALHNGGIIRKFGAINNTVNMTGNAPVGPIQADWVEPVAAHAWTGSAITPAVTVKDGNNVLAEGVYYSAAYENNSQAGTGVVVITDLGDYHTVTTRTFTITGKTLPDSALEAIPAQTYTGSAILPAVVVKDGGKTLARDTDYIVSGANNINVGTATVTVTGRGNYTGSISRTFTISPKALERSFIQSIAAQTYTGSAIIPAVVVKDGSRTLTLHTDYTVSAVNNTSVGTGAVATVSGRGNYTGSATATFSIIARSLTADNIETIAAQLYTGDSVKPAVVVRDGGRILTEGTDYAVAYTNNVSTGTATVTVTGRGNYSGSAVKTFLIYTVPITGMWIEDIPAQTYTGDSIKPVLTVRYGNTVLTAGVHYSVTYNNNINAGTGTATVTGVGSYTETMNKPFTIHPRPITGGWTEDIPAQTYTGDFITPAVTVRDGDTILTAGVHYSVTCINNINAGTATATVTGVGNYSGTESKPFTINPKQITGEWIESIPAQGYTGDSLKPALTVRDGNTILTAGVHYSATYNRNINVGTATVTITGVGNYTGTASKNFLIEDKTQASVPIVAGWIADIPAQTYTGDSIKPALTVIDGNSFLFAGVHYSAAYTNNVNAGTAIVIVTGRGNYSGSVYKYFAITPKPVVDDWIGDIPAQTYTGSYVQPALTVRDGNNILTAGVHYSATYTNNVDAGTATVTIIGLGNYTGSASKNFLIGDGGTSASVSIAAGWIDDIPAQTYTGSAIQPAVTIRNGNTVLMSGADYTTAYSGNTNAGTGTVTVTGVGKYTGTVYKNFTISPKGVAAGWLGTVPDQTYTGASIQPAVTVMDGSRTLTLGMDYTVYYSNNVNAGTATVTIVGTGNYTGTATGTFTIVRSRIPIQESWVQVIPDQYYTGYSIRPAVTVSGLTQGVDYTVSYYNNTAAGTAIAIVTGIGDYSGQVAQSFRIVDTGAEEAASAVLRITPTAGGILVSGLTPGKTLSIYTIKGEKYYSGTAQSDVFRLDNIPKGVYILYHAGQYSKFAY